MKDGLAQLLRMGFYGPSQLVRDARRHGVEVRPVDVLISASDCALERNQDGAPAVRLVSATRSEPVAG